MPTFFLYVHFLILQNYLMLIALRLTLTSTSSITLSHPYLNRVLQSVR
ncbi:hypothetical protein GPAL_2321 [Glaciecola pallidula DSM 14239 = ACAM 615]|uniref:Uncharacterized protein n=1 Tax=Brumicola pallidula DSM 14239 = ACAM 615 TaxID=1121922 RepID=K6ZFP2_9ALTE|nr:hypothetical protein GPAL_2321 [Glaciecola pallidula DSM 14239 = ACAM 615]